VPDETDEAASRRRFVEQLLSYLKTVELRPGGLEQLSSEDRAAGWDDCIDAIERFADEET
jgi:hypothetical protein